MKKVNDFGETARERLLLELEQQCLINFELIAKLQAYPVTDCKHIYDEYDLCFECNAPKPAQVDADRRYMAKQKNRGIVRKTVLVPENRVTELHELCKRWRSEQ